MYSTIKLICIKFNNKTRTLYHFRNQSETKSVIFWPIFIVTELLTKNGHDKCHSFHGFSYSSIMIINQ